MNASARISAMQMRNASTRRAAIVVSVAVASLATGTIVNRSVLQKKYKRRQEMKGTTKTVIHRHKLRLIFQDWRQNIGYAISVPKTPSVSKVFACVKMDGMVTVSNAITIVRAILFGASIDV